MALQLAATAEAINAQIRAAMPELRSVETLRAETDLTNFKGPLPAALTLLRGAKFIAPPGWRAEQKGTADVLVWLLNKTPAHEASAAVAKPLGAYALLDSLITCLNGFVPLADHALQLADFGFASLPASYEVKTAVRFELVLMAN